MASKWVKRWGSIECSALSLNMIENYLIEIRSKVSAFTANKHLRHLRATFNFGKKKRLILFNPMDGIECFPLKKTIRYIPPIEDIDRVISVAKPDIQDYLWAIRDTMARVGEINRLTWDDVVFEGETGYVVLYTRKKKGGSLTPRKVNMTQRLYDILNRRYGLRDITKPWVFCNVYTDWKTGEVFVDSFSYRSTILKTLCKKAGVKRFSYHALRHSGASIMDNEGVPLGAIQKILGHENRTTTEIYLHSLGSAEKEAIAVYEQATEKVTHGFTHSHEKREPTSDSHNQKDTQIT
jgi:integrase